MSWTQHQSEVLVESSFDPGSDTLRYRFWDTKRVIPRPAEGVIHAQILVQNRWENMFFNTVWGKAHDPTKGEGTWLKQKVSKSFSANTGQHTFHLRYRLATAV